MYRSTIPMIQFKNSTIYFYVTFPLVLFIFYDRKLLT